jgi:PadR family transcriptional regulator, regulatory protein PadR
MPPPFRLSHQSLRVLRLFLDAFSDNVRSELTGTDLMKGVGISSGTLYPILLRMEKAGLLSSRWEDERPEDLGRPRRRYYRLEPAGATLAQDALRELGSPMVNPLPNRA